MKTGRREWLAWQRIVRELKELGIDINNNDKLTKAITVWGDEYHNLLKEIELF